MVEDGKTRIAKIIIIILEKRRVYTPNFINSCWDISSNITSAGNKGKSQEKKVFSQSWWSMTMKVN